MFNLYLYFLLRDNVNMYVYNATDIRSFIIFRRAANLVFQFKYIKIQRNNDTQYNMSLLYMDSSPPISENNFCLIFFIFLFKIYKNKNNIIIIIYFSLF